MEKLGRGVVAINQGSGSVFVGWRLLGNDPDAIGFNVYRSVNSGTPIKLNSSTITNVTDYADSGVDITKTNAWFVKPVLNGIEQPASASFTLQPNAPAYQYLAIPLQAPPNGTMPDGTTCTYFPGDCSAGDLDGDGEYEIILKWDPSNAKDNSQSGYTGDVYLDAYKLNGTRLWRIDLGKNIRAGAHYTQFMVYDLDGDGKAEVACKTAPGTIDGQGNYVLMGTDSATADYRNSSGYILSGPEYLTIFEGTTGRNLVTTNYYPPRGTVSDWGDSYGNRVDRFLACIAYLDGVHPSLVMCRGYYTRTVLVAYNWQNGQLTNIWTFDSNVSGSQYMGQGDHSLTVGDVDGDGKDEITYGAMCIGHDGNPVYNTGLGHGDALHLGKMDPNRPGLQVWNIHETPGIFGGGDYRDAATGQVLWGLWSTGDAGRGCSDALLSSYPGFVSWDAGSGIYDLTGTPDGSAPSSCNFLVWWDADVARKTLNSNQIDKYGSGHIFTASGCTSINGTKSTPCLSADLFGDWREEVVWAKSDGTELRIYTTTTMATNRLYTLMHDPQYRLAIAWQNVAYNQPPHTGFYLGPCMVAQPRPPMSDAKMVWRGNGVSNLWDSVSANWRTNWVWITNSSAVVFSPGDTVLFDLTGSNNIPINLNETVSAGAVTVFPPTNHDYIFGGTGSLTGTMTLTKAGPGTLTIRTTNSYTGATLLTEGTLLVNGSLDQSPVFITGGGVWGPSRLGGTGSLGQGVTVRSGGAIAPGNPGTGPGTLTISNALIESGGAINYLDLSDDSTGILKTNDLINVVGNLNLTGSNTIQITTLNAFLSPGTYNLINYSGTLSGGLANLTVAGIPGVPIVLTNPPNAIALIVKSARTSTSLVWRGSGSNWDLMTSSNWLNGASPDWFVPQDSVRFDNSGAASLTVNLPGSVSPASVVVDSISNYTFSGSGSIIGSGGLTKTNSGTLTVSTRNTYTGSTVLGGGTLSVSNLFNGGVASGIGASSKASGNLVFYGSTLKYTGAGANIDRGATLNAAGATIEVASGNLAFSGVFTGAGALTKNGTGLLMLNAVNTYSGGTIVNAGTLQVGYGSGEGGALGTGSVTLNGGTLNMIDLENGQTASWNLIVPTNCLAKFNADGNCTLKGSLTGSGTLTFYTPYVRTALNGDWSGFTGQINVTTDSDGGDFRINNSYGYAKAAINLANLVNAYSLTGSSSIGEVTGGSSSTLSSTAWTIGARNTDATYGGSITGNSITKVGTGTWTLTGNTNTYTGGTTISAGTLQIGNGGTAGSIGTGNITDNATLVFNQSDYITDTNFGIISGAGNLAKRGAGQLALTKAHTYSGATTVETGILALTNSGSIANSSNIIVSAGAIFDVSGMTGGLMTLANGKKISGYGSVNGNFTVGSGAMLAPGGSIGTLTFSNALTLSVGCTNYFEISKSPLTNDVAKVFGALTCGGTLIVTNIGATTLAAGDSFKLFNAASYSGEFSKIILPSLPAGLGWNTNGINTNGSLAVVIASKPVIGPLALSGNSLVMSGSGGVANASYYLLASTNVAQPLSNWTRLLTNQFDNNGNFNFTNAFGTNAQNFYLLQVP